MQFFLPTPEFWEFNVVLLQQISKKGGLMDDLSGVIIRVLCGVAGLYFVGIFLFALLTNS